jgi:hypothetical protein
MSKAYLLAYSDSLGSRDEVKSLLNSMHEVERWRYDLPHAFYIISDSSAEELANRLRTLSGNDGTFVIVEFAGNEQGWLTEASWYLINNKQYKPKS